MQEKSIQFQFSRRKKIREVTPRKNRGNFTLSSVALYSKRTKIHCEENVP